MKRPWVLNTLMDNAARLCAADSGAIYRLGPDQMFGWVTGYPRLPDDATEAQRTWAGAVVSYFRANPIPLAPGTMRADLTKVRQSVLNLLSNAAKFTANGTVTLRVGRDGDEVTLAVSDTGVGMTEEQMGRLFEEFAQAEASTSRHYGGTGLGLSLSRRFCRMMGGEVSVASAPGVGSTFTIRLPVAVQAPEPAEVSGGD